VPQKTPRNSDEAAAPTATQQAVVIASVLRRTSRPTTRYSAYAVAAANASTTPAREIDTSRPIPTTTAVPTTDNTNAVIIAAVNCSLPRMNSITVTIAGYA